MYDETGPDGKRRHTVAEIVDGALTRAPRGTELTDEEVRERMSGNLCRCAAYPNILAAIRQAADR